MRGLPITATYAESRALKIPKLPAYCTISAAAEEVRLMLLIVGFGRRKKKDYGEVIRLKCPRCNNTVSYRHTCTRTWLTLYFIPVLPYRSERRLECPICSHGVKIYRDDIEAVRQGRMEILPRLEQGDESSTRAIS